MMKNSDIEYRTKQRKMMEEMESDILSGKHRKKTSILDKISVIDGKLGAIAF